jgi:hypothetical protein
MNTSVQFMVQDMSRPPCCNFCNGRTVHLTTSHLYEKGSCHSSAMTERPTSDDSGRSDLSSRLTGKIDTGLREHFSPRLLALIQQKQTESYFTSSAVNAASSGGALAWSRKTH